MRKKITYHRTARCTVSLSVRRKYLIASAEHTEYSVAGHYSLGPMHGDQSADWSLCVSSPKRAQRTFFCHSEGALYVVTL